MQSKLDKSSKNQTLLKVVNLREGEEDTLTLGEVEALMVTTAITPKVEVVVAKAKEGEKAILIVFTALEVETLPLQE